MNLLEESTKSELIVRIQKLTPEAKSLWGKMNVNQMICHCTDQFRVALGEKEASGQPASFFGRTVLRWMVLYVIPIPKNVPTSPSVDQMKEGTKPKDFESDRKTLIARIEKFVSAPEEFSWAPHFKFGTLGKSEWAILATKHLDHHLKQFGV